MNIDEVRSRLRKAWSVTVLTGAGVSAESGVPTFRGPGGLWQGMRAEELATPTAFAKDPKLVWEFYDWRRGVLSGVSPNAAHLALARLEENSKDFTLITQNVDGLHLAGGSTNVLELHGNIWRVRCTDCAEVTENRDVPIEYPPLCRCGSLLRPDIVWFGEMLPGDVFKEATEAAARADVMLVIGTSGVVQPAASLVPSAKQNKALCVEINPEETPLTPAMDLTITNTACETVPKLI